MGLWPEQFGLAGEGYFLAGLVSRANVVGTAVQTGGSEPLSGLVMAAF
jgi:uncharacterized membrane protein YiaA